MASSLMIKAILLAVLVGIPLASGQLTVQQGSVGGAVPPFGGYVPGEGATIGLGMRGAGGSGSISIFADQGSSRSSVSESPSLTISQGGTGYFFSGTMQPFVTGFVPVVDVSLPPGPPALGSSFPTRGTVARLDGQVRAPGRRAAVQRLMIRADRAARGGRLETARKYLAQALSQADGATRAVVQDRIRRLPQ